MIWRLIGSLRMMFWVQLLLSFLHVPASTSRHGLMIVRFGPQVERIWFSSSGLIFSESQRNSGTNYFKVMGLLSCLFLAYMPLEGYHLQSICFHQSTELTPFSPPFCEFPLRQEFSKHQQQIYRTLFLQLYSKPFCLFCLLPMDSTSKSIPISAIQAYHSRERKLFSRMVLDLHMDSSLSMEIIAFWLWLEEWEKTDVIDHINSFNDSNLQTVAFIGHDFIDALHLDTPPDQLTVGFHQNAVQGIKYYLNSVCLKAFDDIRRKAEQKVKFQQMEMLVRQMSRTYLEYVDGRWMIPSLPHSIDSVAAMRPLCSQPSVPHGEGSSRCISTKFQPLGILDVERGIQSGYPFNLTMLRHRTSVPQFPQIGHVLPIMAQNINSGMVLRNHYEIRAEARQPPRDNIPIEERTLFVTFSNGYPLTKEELHNFFMRHYGDVELVNIQKPKEGKPPQYAYVSFYRLATLLRVLNGTEKVKFITKGKHLWARRFIPKRSHCGEDIYTLLAHGVPDEELSSQVQDP